jgi:hypothetical protein
VSTTRRAFLRRGGAAAALLLSFRVRSLDATEPTVSFEPNAFLRVAPDDTVTL